MPTNILRPLWRLHKLQESWGIHFHEEPELIMNKDGAKLLDLIFSASLPPSILVDMVSCVPRIYEPDDPSPPRAPARAPKTKLALVVASDDPDPPAAA